MRVSLTPELTFTGCRVSAKDDVIGRPWTSYWNRKLTVTCTWIGEKGRSICFFLITVLSICVFLVYKFHDEVDVFLSVDVYLLGNSLRLLWLFNSLTFILLTNLKFRTKTFAEPWASTQLSFYIFLYILFRIQSE